MKRVVLTVLVLLLALTCGGFWWGSGCSAVEKAVDDGKLQLRNGFIWGPPGFSQTPDYLGYFAGMLGKRISSDSNGWEKFKLTSTCGGNTRVESWARAKNIRADGSWGPRSVGGLLPVGGQWVITMLAVLSVVLLGGGISFTRRRAYG